MIGAEGRGEGNRGVRRGRGVVGVDEGNWRGDG